MSLLLGSLEALRGLARVPRGDQDSRDGISPLSSFRKSQGRRAMAMAIGGGLSGRGTRTSVGHSKDRSMRCFNCCIDTVASSEARRTPRFPPESPGGPSGALPGYPMPIVRGAPTLAESSGRNESTPVEIPLCSMTRATSPTDRQQNGQTGINSARST